MESHMKSNLLGTLPADVPRKGADKAPSPADRVVENAHHAKVHATDCWVRGEITAKKHAEIHKRADSVIKGKK